MFECYLIIYSKRDGSITYRFVKHEPMIKKGIYTSLGWYVVDVQAFYKGVFLPLESQMSIIKQDLNKIYLKESKRNKKKVDRFNKRRFIIRKIFHKYL